MEATATPTQQLNIFDIKLNPTVTLVVGGEAREVELKHIHRREDGAVAHVHGVCSTIGNGVARYPDYLTLWQVPEGGKAHHGNKVATDSDGNTWQYHYATMVRNRQARIVGWTEAVGITNHYDNERVAK